MNWESKININQVMEIRSRTLCYLGVGALQKVNDICDWLKNQGIDKVLICTDKTVYKVTGVWDVLEPAMKSGSSYLSLPKSSMIWVLI
jgi:alcohol dehydrogenase class IV